MKDSELRDPEFTQELQRLYIEMRLALGRARVRLELTLRDVNNSIEYRDLVRAQLLSVRIKEFESLRICQFQHIQDAGEFGTAMGGAE